MASYLSVRADWNPPTNDEEIEEQSVFSGQPRQESRSREHLVGGKCKRETPSLSRRGDADNLPLPIYWHQGKYLRGHHGGEAEDLYFLHLSIQTQA